MATRRRPNSSMRPSASSFGNGVHWRICHSTAARSWDLHGIFLGAFPWGFCLLSDLMEFCGLKSGVSSVFVWHSECYLSFFWWGQGGFLQWGIPSRHHGQYEVLVDWSDSTGFGTSPASFSEAGRGAHLHQLVQSAVAPWTVGLGAKNQWADATNLFRFWKSKKKTSEGINTQYIYNSFRGGFLPGVFWAPRGQVTGHAPGAASDVSRTSSCRWSGSQTSVPRRRASFFWALKRGECSMVDQRNIGDLITKHGDFAWQTSVFFEIMVIDADISFFIRHADLFDVLNKSILCFYQLFVGGFPQNAKISGERWPHKLDVVEMACWDGYSIKRYVWKFIFI